MRPYSVKPVSRVRGEIILPGDKSIAHRAVIVSAISSGTTLIENFPSNKDCLCTVNVFKKLGIKIVKGKVSDTIIVMGRGLSGLNRPQSSIFVAESGTTLRLILGVLAGQNFKVTLTAGPALSKRPMLRVTAPLRLMGAVIDAERAPGAQHEERAPITMEGCPLGGITYKMPVASAQVKSALLLAALYSRVSTKIIEPIKTRDHTERMLQFFGADIKIKDNQVIVTGGREMISRGCVYVPGDISSASFFIVAALILADSYLVIKKISLNPSRTGIITVLKRMGAEIKINTPQNYKITSGELIGDLIVKNSSLKGVTVKRKEIPLLIDELPILMVAACFAKGKTTLEGVEELHVKETDRVKSMCTNLAKMGANIKVIKQGNLEKIVIHGAEGLKAANVSSFNDHRTAMSMIVAGLKASGKTKIDDISCIAKSFPNFLDILNTLVE